MRLTGITWRHLALAAACGWLLSELIVLATGDLSMVLFAVDVTLYLDAARRWLGGGPFYEAWQIAGPYQIEFGAILYPPPILVLLVPFTVLPLWLWWAIPVDIVIYALWRLRPAVLGWAGVIAALAVPSSLAAIANGNPVIWAVAALALGTLQAPAAPFAAFKISVAPFALFGSWRASWWMGGAVFLGLCAAFLPMWPDYVAVVANSHNPRGLFYSIADVFILLIPLAAWADRTRHGIPAPSWLVTRLVRG